VWGITPSQLDREDIGRLQRGLEALDLYNAAKKPFNKWTPADAALMWPVLTLQNERDRKNAG
jgi:hypothetical protein